MIDQSTVQHILDVSEIVDVVSDFVSLKKRGANHIGLCPFHNEKTPSFSVSPAKGIYKCFGCGKGGGAVNFVMEHERLSYAEALKWLAKKYNIEVQEKEESEDEIKTRNERESQLIVTSFAQQHFTKQIWETDEGVAVGLSYLRERKFSDEIIKKFELGFCPEKKGVLTQAALKRGYNIKYLVKTGLTIKSESSLKDRFSGRIIFPIHGIAGKVVAFGGRTMSQSKKVAKYINSPESDIYHKSHILYGIYQSRRSIIKEEKCYLVEGYTDVISMHQAGIENVVASSGTSLTQEQVRLIRRFTNNVTIIYDGDQAGIKASLRGIDMILEENVNVKVLPLPDGEDPDSFSKSLSKHELSKYIEENETDFIGFKTRMLMKDTENDPISRARLISDIVRTISVIPDEIVRAEYLKECSHLLKVREEALYNDMRKLKFRKREDDFRREQREKRKQAYDAETKKDEQPVETINHCENEERELLRLLLKYGTLKMFEVESPEDEDITESISVAEFILSELEKDQIESVDDTIRAIFSEYHAHLGNEEFDPERFFILHHDEKINALASDLIPNRYTESEFWKKKGSFVEEEHEILHTIVPKVLQEYKLKIVRHLWTQKNDEIKQAIADNDLDRITDIQQSMSNIKAIEEELSGKLGNRVGNKAY